MKFLLRRFAKQARFVVIERSRGTREGMGKIAFAFFMIHKLRALHSHNEFIIRALFILPLY